MVSSRAIYSVNWWDLFFMLFVSFLFVMSNLIFYVPKKNRNAKHTNGPVVDGSLVGGNVGWDDDGFVVRILFGISVGDFVGIIVGDVVGSLVGMLVGDVDGTFDGDFVGITVGARVGDFVGISVGDFDGTFDGDFVGKFVGDVVGMSVGGETPIVCRETQNEMQSILKFKRFSNSETTKRGPEIVIIEGTKQNKINIAFCCCTMATFR